MIAGKRFLSEYQRKIVDVAGICFLSVVLFIIVWLLSDRHIYFSHNSGYYDEAFFLKIKGGGKNSISGKHIYYTLDGSEPTREDYPYDKDHPIYIADATDHENLYAARTDVGSAGWGDNNTYTAPDYCIDKCNVVRASVFDEEGNCLDSITGIFFVGFQDKSGYEGLYTVSLITDPDNLFDPETGIYVKGNGETPNYRCRGTEWERPAAISIFDDQQREILSQNCGIRIKGGTSRSLTQKSIRCYAREEYCGDSKFQAELFYSGHLPHRIALYAGGNDYYCKVKDPMVHELTESLNYATMRFIPCALFLDGEYWGLYYISEDYDDAYISDHFDVKKENVVMIKSGYLKEGEDADFAEYQMMRNFIIQEDMTVPANYERACQMMDMSSFIDYYAVQIYIERHSDWPSANYALWKTREMEGGSGFGDGRWRWMLFDVNSAGMDDIEYDSLYEVLHHEGDMFQSFYQNEEFRRQFAERICYIGKELLSGENCRQFLEDYTRDMKKQLMKSNRRFYAKVDTEDFDKEIAWLTTYFEKRYDAVWDFLCKNMGEDWLYQNGIQK